MYYVCISVRAGCICEMERDREELLRISVVILSVAIPLYVIQQPML